MIIFFNWVVQPPTILLVKTSMTSILDARPRPVGVLLGGGTTKKAQKFDVNFSCFRLVVVEAWDVLKKRSIFPNKLECLLWAKRQM